MSHRKSAQSVSRRIRISQQKGIGTFSPAYLKFEDEPLRNTIAEVEFGEKKWVWVKDDKAGFLKAWIIKEDGDLLHVQCTNDLVRYHGFKV